MNKSPNDNKIPEEALKLLPWYATGLLSSQEREYMQSALSKYPELQRMLDLEHKAIQVLKEDKSILEQSCLKATEVRLEKVLSRLPSDNKSIIKNKQGASDGAVQQPKKWFASMLSLLFSGRSTFQYAAFASVTAVTIALLFAFVAPLVNNENTFYPATTSSIKMSRSSTTTILIGLNTKVNDPRILKILKENRAKIDAIPEKNNMYRLSLSDKLNAKQTKNLLEKLTGHKELFWFAGEEF